MSKKIEKFINRWAIVFLLWLFLALLSATETYLNYVAKGIESSFFTEIFWKLANWLPWFLLTPVIYYLAQKIQFRKSRSLPIIGFYFIIGIIITLVKILIYYLASLPLRGPITRTFFFTDVYDVIISNFLGNYLIFWVLLFICYALIYYKKMRENELRTIQLEMQLTRAQLQVLKMQLQPHFLFNTLNSISALIHKDVDLADTMITKLSDLLRITLDSSDEQEVILSEEISFLKNYLDIEKIRFQERLQVKTDIHPNTLNVLVPNLILQPLVENAIQHGIAPFSKQGTIFIQSNLKGQYLELLVRDNGPGIWDDLSVILKKGIGLKNTKERLEQLYRGKHKFELVNRKGGGLEIRIKLPRH